MLQYSLEVGICWAILYLVYIAFLRRETFFSINRWYLLGSLLLGLFIPVLRTIPAALQEEAVVVNEALYFISAGPELIAANFSIQSEVETVFTLSNLLLLIYSLGVLVVGSRMIFGLLKIKNLYSQGRRTDKGSFTLIETSNFHLPFSFLNCVFFSKEMPINDSIEKILKHELTHVHSWHTLDVLFTEVLQVVFWFNPLIILYKKAIKESHEYVADASVLEDTSQKIYGQILLRQSQSGIQIALANHFFHSHIKNRLNMMKQKKSKRPAMLKYLFAVPVILLLMVLFQSQTLPLDKSTEELTSIVDDNNHIYQELQKDFEELYHSTDHNKNIMKTVGQFENLLNSYRNKYHANQDYIKASFRSIGRSMGVSISFGEITFLNSFQHFMFIVPKKLLADFQAGKLPEYDELLDSEMLNRNSSYGFKVTEGDTFPPGPPSPPIYEMQAPPIPPAPPSLEVIWKQIEQDEKIEINIDGRSVTTKEAIKLKDQLSLEMVGMHNPHARKIQFVEFVTSEVDHYEYVPGNPAQVSKISEQKIDKEVFKVVQEMPRFPGCEEGEEDKFKKEECAKVKLLEFIYANLKYPEEARVNGIEGTSVVQFIIEKDGSISELNLVRDIGGKTGEATMKVMEKMKQNYTWKPGYQKGKAVRVLFTLPINFKMTDLDVECCNDEKDNNGTAQKEETSKMKQASKAHEMLSDAKIFKVVEEMPRFPGCEDMDATKEARELCAKSELLQFVYRRLNYPKEAREKGIDGTAVLQFVIDKTGHVVNPQVVRDVEGYFEAPIMDVVNEMISQKQIWTPGKQKGEPVNVLYTLPVKFILEQLGVDKENQPSQAVKKEKVEDPNNNESWVTGLAPSKVLNALSTSTLSEVSIDYYTDEAGPVNVSLFNTAGQLLKSKDLDVLQGKNTDMISLNANIAGMYIVTVTQGQSRISRKIFLK